MKNGSIWAIGNLEAIEERLEKFSSLLSTICEYGATEHASISEKALGGLVDLLDSIRSDFRADIDYFERCVEGGATA